MHKNYFFKKQYCSTDLFKISLKFTDKAGFLEHVSVNGSDFVKCSTCSISTSRRDYGQTAIFDHFVRNRHFSIEPFTDRRPIFIDVSVNAGKLRKNKLCPPV